MKVGLAWTSTMWTRSGPDDFEAVQCHGWSDLHAGAGGDEVVLIDPEVH
jgi:hypothetical protein